MSDNSPCICIVYYFFHCLQMPIMKHNQIRGFKPCKISTRLKSKLHVIVYRTADSKLAEPAEGICTGLGGGSGFGLVRETDRDGRVGVCRLSLLGGLFRPPACHRLFVFVVDANLNDNERFISTLTLKKSSKNLPDSSRLYVTGIYLLSLRFPWRFYLRTSKFGGVPSKTFLSKSFQCQHGR